MPAPIPACTLCGNAHGNQLHAARERMFGWGGEFLYLECGGCGCLQLLDVPADLARYYPPGYHSLAPAPRPRSRRPALPPELAGTCLIPDSRILDVGCGTGALLLQLAALGFTHLEGVEPHLDHDLEYPQGVRIHRCYLREMPRGPWDLVMLHHSFEHMPEPAAILRAIADRLAPSGECLIRIPVADSWAWRHYGVDWVQLDAPRHLFLHTEASLRRLAAAAGLEVRSVRYDSTDFQFWGSEQYRRGQPLFPPAGASLWSRRRARWRRLITTCVRRDRARAARLNRLGQGDSAAFVLRPAPRAD